MLSSSERTELLQINEIKAHSKAIVDEYGAQGLIPLCASSEDYGAHVEAPWVAPNGSGSERSVAALRG